MWAISPGGHDEAVGLYRIEVNEGPGRAACRCLSGEFPPIPVRQWRADYPWYSNPQFVALAEPTLYAGLRRAGFPDE